MSEWATAMRTSPPDWGMVREQRLSDYTSGTRQITELISLINLVVGYNFEDSDEHFSNPEYTAPLARLLQLLLHKRETDLNTTTTLLEKARTEVDEKDRKLKIHELEKEEEANTGAADNLNEIITNIREDNDNLVKDKTRLREQVRQLQQEKQEIHQLAETQKSELKASNREFAILERQLDEARRLNDTKDIAAAESDGHNRQMRNEHKDMVERFSTATKELERLRTQLNKTTADLDDVNARKTVDDETKSLMIQELQQDNAILTRQKFDAEEALAECERDAHQSSITMKEWHDEAVKALRAQFDAREKELLKEIQSAGRELQGAYRGSDRDEEFSLLQQEVERLRTALEISQRGGGSSTKQLSTVADAAATADYLELQKSNKDLRDKLDDLQAELQQYEIGTMSRDEENLRLRNALREYEEESRGMKTLSNALKEARRKLEERGDDNYQLRERLNKMEDVSAHNKALKKLALGLGATAEDLSKLEVDGASTELDTLRQEVAALKDETVWLEKERKHWMHKVRLQPLLDTKLRYEIGLTEDQRQTIERIIEKMKEGVVVVEEEGGTFKDRYFELKKQMDEQVQAAKEQAAKDAKHQAATAGMSDDLASEIQAIKRMIQENRGANTTATTGPDGQPLPRANDEALHAALIQSQNDKIEQLQATIAEKLKEVMDAQAVAARAADDRKQAEEELETFRVGHASVGVGGSTILRQSTSSFHSLGRAELCMVDEKAMAQLRRQLRVAEEAQHRLIKKLAEQEEAEKDRKEAMQKMSTDLDAAVDVRKKLESDVEALNEEILSSKDKIRELEKINGDFKEQLQTTGGSSDALKKVVLLRQRETKLLERLRLLTQEKAQVEETVKRHEDYIETTLQSMLDASDPEKRLVRRSCLGLLSLEDEMLNGFRGSLKHIEGGKLFRADEALASKMTSFASSLTIAEQSGAIRHENHKLRAELDSLKIKLIDAEKALERAAAGADGAADSNENSISTDASTWRQKCALYSKQLESRDEMIHQLEEAHRQELEAVRVVRNEGGDNGAAAPDTPLTRGNTGAQNDANATTNATTNNNNNNNKGDELDTRRIAAEDEIARLKSVNVALMQSALQFQRERKLLVLRTQTAEQRAQLVEGTLKCSEGELASATLSENLRLQQECESAQQLLKTMRLRNLTIETNFRIAANEASAYKMGAYRLYRQYAESVGGAIEIIRAQQRSIASALTVRQADALNGRLHCYEDLLGAAEAQQIEDAAKIQDLHSTIASLDVNKEAEAQDLTSDKVALRASERKIAELECEADFNKTKVQRQEAYVTQLLKELASVEAGAQFAVDDTFMKQLEELRATVFAKSEAPPVALAMNSSSATSKDEMAAANDHRTLFDKIQAQSKENARLNGEVAALKGEKAAVQAKYQASLEQGKHSEHRINELIQMLDAERTKFKMREESAKTAAQQQLFLAQRAAEHNVNCMKEMLAGKEQTIAQLQQQIQVDRNRHLEHQVVDSARMERLHEQLFKESTTMVERFRETIAGASALSQPQPAPSNLHPSEALISQVESLTAEILKLRKQNEEVANKNTLLEQQLEAQIGVNRKEFAEALQSSDPNVHQAIVNAESALLGINRDQAAALDALAAKEQRLTEDVTVARNETARLTEALNQARIVEEDLRRQLASAGQAVTHHQSVAEQHQQQDHAALCPKCPDLLNQIQILNQRVVEMQAVAPQGKSQDDAVAYWKSKVDEEAAKVNELMAQIGDAKATKKHNETMKDQLQQTNDENDRLVRATAALKQKIVEMARDTDRRTNQATAEGATVQRLQQAHEDSRQQIHSLQIRIQSLEMDVAQRVAREQDLSAKLQSSRATALDQHQLIASKDKQVADLRRELANMSHNTPTLPPPRVVHSQTQTTETYAIADVVRVESIPKSVTDATTQCALTKAGAAGAAATGGSTNTRIKVVEREPNVQVQQQAIVGAVSKQVEAMKREHEVKLAQAQSKLGSVSKENSRLLEELRAAETAKSSLSQQHARKLNEMRSKLDAAEIGHKREVMELMEQHRRRTGAQPAPKMTKKRPAAADSSTKETQTDSSAPVVPPLATPGSPNAAATPGAASAATKAPSPKATPRRQDEEKREENTKAWIELQSASSHLGLHETIRKQNKKIESLSAALKESTSKADLLESHVKELDLRKQEILELKTQLAAHTGSPQTASPGDVRAHKKVVMDLEDRIDELKRRVQVEKEDDLLKLRNTCEKLTNENSQINRELKRYRGIPETEGAAEAQAATQQAAERAAIERNVTLEGQLLDLRFERETLSLKLNRLERHMQDIMAADAEFLKQRAAGGGPNGGASPGERGPVGPTHAHREIAAMEGVIENMKTVITRLKGENNMLRSATVSSSKYVEIQREVKHLRTREAELVEKLRNVMNRVQTLQGKSSPREDAESRTAVADLQRKLRLAEETIAHHRNEITSLRTVRPAQPLEPHQQHQQLQQQQLPPQTRPATGGATGAAADVRIDPYSVPPYPLQYAPEHHGAAAHHLHQH